MSSLSTLPKGDSAWLLRKAVERIMQQVSVLETNIGSSTTGNSANTEIIFNDAGTLRGDAGLTYNKTTDALTITGDLTVDTSTLKVDSTNDVVLIGSATKATYGANKLEVRGASISDASLGGNNTGNLAILTTDSQAIDTGGVLSLGGGFNGTTPYMFAGIAGRKETATNAIAQGYLQLFTTNVSNGITERYRIAGDGVHTWRNVGGVAGTAMTLNANVLAMGVTPNTWTVYKALQVQGASIFSTTGNDTGFGSNVYYEGGYKFRSASSDKATRYEQFGGSHSWHYTASPGTAGNTATFTQAMTLDASGNLGIGVTPVSKLTVSGGVSLTSAASNHFLRDGTAWIWSSDGASTGTARGGLYADGSSNLNLYGGSTLASHLQINSSGDVISKVNTSVPTVANSQMVFNLTTNTNLRITVRGTDGTLRSANITLAP